MQRKKFGVEIYSTTILEKEKGLSKAEETCYGNSGGQL